MDISVTYSKAEEQADVPSIQSVQSVFYAAFLTAASASATLAVSISIFLAFESAHFYYFSFHYASQNDKLMIRQAETSGMVR